MTHASYSVDRGERGAASFVGVVWPAAIAAVVLLGIVAGGSSLADSAAFTVFRLCSAAIMAAALLCLVRAHLTPQEWSAIGIALLAIGLVSLHLAPLPYSIFASLPGRGYAVTAFSLAGIPPQPMPLTLNPEATRACLLAMMPALAIFLATLTLSGRARWLVAGSVLLGVFANIMLGLAQRFQGRTSSLYLYEFGNLGLATGFFSNRNNFAMLLCIAIPLIWAVTHRLTRRAEDNRLIIIAGGVVMMGMVFLGLAVSGSRSGILLGILSLALSTAMIWTPSASSRTRWSLLALLGAALIVGQFGMMGLLRVADTDLVTEYRTQIAGVTLRAAADYLPFGSGFGTFQEVYAMHETPSTMLSAYVNHAHNDWIELWLEGGLPAAALMACFLALFLWQAVRVWNPRGPYAPHVLPRAASIGVLVLLLHSLAEYPLRMPALAGIFALLLAIVLSPLGIYHTTPKRKPRTSHEEIPEPRLPVGASAPPVFWVKDRDGLDANRPRR